MTRYSFISLAAVLAATTPAAVQATTQVEFATTQINLTDALWLARAKAYRQMDKVVSLASRLSSEDQRALERVPTPVQLPVVRCHEVQYSDPQYNRWSCRATAEYAITNSRVFYTVQTELGESMASADAAFAVASAKKTVVPAGMTATRVKVVREHCEKTTYRGYACVVTIISRITDTRKVAPLKPGETAWLPPAGGPRELEISGEPPEPVFAAFQGVFDAPEKDAGTEIGAAVKQLEAGDFVAALAAANKAVRFAPDNYKGYYYQAMAYYGLGELDKAAAAAAQAETLAPPEAKADAHKLVDVIAASKDVADAEAAEADGLYAKAARLYEQAWKRDEKRYNDALKGATIYETKLNQPAEAKRLRTDVYTWMARFNERLWSNDRSRTDAAFVAADVYANYLDRPVDAARILREIIAATSSAEVRTRAETELTRLQPRLRALAVSIVEKAKTSNRLVGPRRGLEDLSAADAVDPTYVEIYMTRIALLASGSDGKALVAALIQAGKRGARIEEALVLLPNRARWVKDADVRQYVLDFRGEPYLQMLAALPNTKFTDCAETCPEMVIIPPGDFTMGRDNGASSEKPAHTVTIARPFAIGKLEITVSQWFACYADSYCQNFSPFRQTGDTRDGNLQVASEIVAPRPQMPANLVGYEDALQYVRWLSKKTGKTYRLPSEAEWERACAPSLSADETPTAFCGSDSADAVAWHSGNSLLGAQDAGRRKANRWGLYDMNGNSAELTADCWHATYAGAPRDGSAWTTACAGESGSRAARGGSFLSPSTSVGARARRPAVGKAKDVGIRVVRELP